jgi:adenylate cyclase
MSEKMSPSQVALLLNDYLSRMTEVIFKYEGTLDKYIGDAIMAVFGAPLDMPDHAYRSIMAALEMQERLTEFNAERKEGPHLRIRIGINSGKVVAADQHQKSTRCSDTVTTPPAGWRARSPSRMVVIGQNTHEIVAGWFECKSLGASLKAKSEVTVFR